MLRNLKYVYLFFEFSTCVFLGQVWSKNFWGNIIHTSGLIKCSQDKEPVDLLLQFKLNQKFGISSLYAGSGFVSPTQFFQFFLKTENVFLLHHCKFYNYALELQFLEPGYYEEGNFGIRLENVLIVKKADTKFNFGDKGYLSFEHITWVSL